MSAPDWSPIVSAHWPELCARLGPRLDAFMDAARQKARQHGLQLDAAVARYLNLCFALGPNFEDKAENEWALALLSNQALGDWVKLHQLVRQAASALRRLEGEGARAAAQLERADAAFMDAYDAHGAQTQGSESPLLARLACDVEMLDIHLLDMDWRQEYSLDQGQWSRMPVSAVPRDFRIRAGQAAPRQISVLSHAAGTGPMARVQLRQHMHACCEQDRHPALSLTGPHGLARWHGHAATALSWEAPAQAMAAAPQAQGQAQPQLLLAETQASISLLKTECCGLRDQGTPTGALETWLWCYRADQFLFAFQRSARLQASWPRGPEVLPTAEPSRLRYECDGQALPTRSWAQGLDQDLPQQLLAGLDQLFALWSAGLHEPAMHADLGLFTGQAGLSWGWRESSQGLDAPAWLRVLGQLDLNQSLELELSGELRQGVTRTRVRLTLKGALPWVCALQRDESHSDLMAQLLGAAASWQIGFQIAFDPIAVDEGAMLGTVSGCTGQLSAECGLRPRPQGGGGWQFFMRMQTTPVTVAVLVQDPVLGQTRKTLALLAGAVLLDWSLG